MTEAQLAELLKSIANEVHVRQPGQFTSAEAQAILGSGRRGTIEALKKLMTEGKVKPVYVLVENVWGKKSSVQGWEVVKND